MYFGAAYYPEHWSEERWETDVKMMKEAGFNIVRLGEFSWSKIERYEGSYDFAWLDKIIQMLGAGGIEVILGTPTAAPPKWLMDKYPDIYMVDSKGIVRGFGSRRHYCYNNSNYKKYAGAIVEKMADHYADNKYVIAWQTDNEFGNANTTLCYCDHCKKEFQSWLRDKYNHIDNLNTSWGTVFWSQTYNNWDEIIVPRQTSDYLHNPGTVLDFKRFSSDSAVKFQKIQVDLLKSLAPAQKITHNMMGLFNQIDYYKLATELDIVSLDNYPNMAPDLNNRAQWSALNNDVTRGIKGGNYWVTEQQSGIPGGDILFSTPKPGELRKWTYQSIAHGGNGIMYFRWRSCLFGAEEYWHGILSHDGKVNRRYNEVQAVGAELSRISSLLDNTEVRAKVAILRSYDNEWVFEIQPQIRDYSCTEHMEKYYRYFYENNIPVDIISPDSDYSSYRLIIIPNLIISSDATVKKIYNYVNNGGSIVMDFRTGVKEWDNRVCEMTLPGKYSELLGIEISDYGIIPRGETTGIRLEDSFDTYYGRLWYDVIGLKGAIQLGFYTEDYFEGTPAITVNDFGDGKAFYIGTEADVELMDRFMNQICTQHEIKPLLGITTKGIEIIKRSGKSREYFFVINHNMKSQFIKLDKAYKEILSGDVADGCFEIKENDLIILEENIL
jgi:beta-galactosidase